MCAKHSPHTGVAALQCSIRSCVLRPKPFRSAKRPTVHAYRKRQVLLQLLEVPVPAHNTAHNSKLPTGARPRMPQVRHARVRAARRVLDRHRHHERGEHQVKQRLSMDTTRGVSARLRTAGTQGYAAEGRLRLP